MEINFKEYVGFAGDSHALLIAETDTGAKESILFNRAYFYNFNRRRAEKKLRRRLIR